MTKLSPLQKEFLDVLFSDSDIAASYTEEEEIESLIADIKTMDAIDLRKNIKAFKETAS